ncbi:phosphoribosylglycinamide formyltransferase [Paenilisteria newyorkensis]|uniref:phosphoribosylglycinamide formyltransferase n=1 Tax=Listeria newyorkensis TaxID=1497681 RepID=UPI000669C7D6|nr:phosphoribosylglycinamide formyltransferase [Listeria newyorkensis]KMT62779.1 phosphoribosylglycinamide formyltransferase [Listeria newyorkensis]
MKIAIFASGSGSNFQALVDDAAIKESVALLVCDKPGAFVLERAEAAGIPVFVFAPKAFADKAAFEREIVAKLQKSGVEFLVLAGYMRLIGPTLLEAYENKIVNLHPSLLPAFPGKDAIGQAATAGVVETGVTAHFVDAGMDTGPIIAQQSVAILPEDTIDSLTTRIHKVEHAFYPEVVKKIIGGQS